MDSRFLEFLGHYFLGAARNQEMLTQLQTWMRVPPPKKDAPGELFQKFYGLGPLSAGNADQAAAWQKALENFQASLASWWELMEVVPRSEYQALEKKIKALEEKVAEQARTIQQLRRSGSPDPDAPVAAVDAFAKLMEKQADDFQDLMQNMTAAFKSKA